MLQDLFEELSAAAGHAQLCLQTACRQLKDQSLQSILATHAAQLQAMQSDMAHCARQMHLACPADAAGPAAVIHGRSTFQHALVTQDRYAILEQCRHALERCMLAYEMALSQKMPAWLSQAMARQSQALTHSYRQIESMCIKAMPQWPVPSHDRLAETASSPQALGSRWPHEADLTRPIPA